MQLLRVTALLLIWLPSMVLADGPSFDCFLASTRIEKAICQSQSLSNLDLEMADTYFSIVKHKSGSERRRFVAGARAWFKHRNTRCSSGHSVDYACLTQLYRERIASLKNTRTPSTSFYELIASRKWINLASRAQEYEAINLADQYQREAGQHFDFKVLLSKNGWFAIVAGPVNTATANSKISYLSTHINGFDPDTFLSSGSGYHNLVYRARPKVNYAYQSAVPTITRQRSKKVSSATCSPSSIRDRQAMCYIIAAGEYGCAEGLEEVSGYNHGNFLGEVSAAVACSIAITKIQNKEINPDMLVASALIGGLDSIGEGLSSRGNKLLGGLISLIAVGSKIGVAANCAQQEAKNCGY